MKIAIHKNAIASAKARRMASAMGRAANYLSHTAPTKSSPLHIHIGGITILSFMCLNHVVNDAPDWAFVLLAIFDIIILPIIASILYIAYQILIRIYKAEKKASSTHQSRKAKYFKKLKKMQSLKK